MQGNTTKNFYSSENFCLSAEVGGTPATGGREETRALNQALPEAVIAEVRSIRGGREPADLSSKR
jgi:hypothetical protein